MGLVDLQGLQPEDGENADAVDVNAQVDRIVQEINGNLDEDNITAGALTEQSLSTAVKPSTLANNVFVDHVNSGCLWTISSGLTGTMSAGNVYINGLLYTISTVASKVFTASKDTYVDVGTNGTIDYTEVANNANAPAIAADHLRLAVVITDGTAIKRIDTTARDNQGNAVRYRLPSAEETFFCARTVQADGTFDGAALETSQWDVTSTSSWTALWVLKENPYWQAPELYKAVQDVTLFVTIEVLMRKLNNASYIEASLLRDGGTSGEAPYLYLSSSNLNSWSTLSRTYEFDLDAGQDIKLQLAARVGSGTGTVSRIANYYPTAKVEVRRR